MSEEGAVFQSYLDGQTILLSPEVSIETQKAIGSDIMMALDQCIPSTADEATARAALEITHRWAARSLAARGDSPQAMFGIVQGALFQNLRRESADAADARCRSMASPSAASRSAKGKVEREDAVRIHRAAPARRQAALPHGRRHAARYPRSRPSRRGHVRLHHPDAGRAARRGRSPRAAFCNCAAAFTSSPRRSSIRHACCPTCARYSRAYLHHLTKTRRDTRLAAAREAQHPLLPPAHARDPAEHPGRSVPGALRRNARSCTRAIPTIRFASKSRSESKSLTLGDLRSAHGREGFASIRQISSGEIMHSRTPPMEEARKLYIEQSHLAERLPLSEGETPENAVATGRSGMSGWAPRPTHGGDPLLRRQPRPTVRPAHAHRQLRERSRSLAACLSAQPRLHLPASQRTGRHPRAGKMAVGSLSRTEVDAFGRQLR